MIFFYRFRFLLEDVMILSYIDKYIKKLGVILKFLVNINNLNLNYYLQY